MFKVILYEDSLGRSQVGDFIKDLKTISGGRTEMKTWEEFEKELNISPEDEKIIEMEMKLLEAMVAVREEQGLSQANLAEKCNVKQPVIARLEKAVHSPRLNTILKVLLPLGYTLQITPIEKQCLTKCPAPQRQSVR